MHKLLDNWHKASRPGDCHRLEVVLVSRALLPLIFRRFSSESCVFLSLISSLVNPRQHIDISTSTGGALFVSHNYRAADITHQRQGITEMERLKERNRDNASLIIPHQLVTTLTRFKIYRTPEPIRCCINHTHIYTYSYFVPHIAHSTVI